MHELPTPSTENLSDTSQTEEVNPSLKELPLGMPPVKQQSWGAIIAIFIIVVMIIVGAFYAWGKRTVQQQYPSSAVQQ